MGSSLSSIFGYAAAQNHEEIAFMEAITDNDLQAVREFIDQGIDVNCTDDESSSPLHVAVFLGRDQIAGMLLAAGASASALGQFGGQPLHVAAFAGRITAVRMLLNHKADVDAVDEEGRTPLHLAADKGYLQICKELRSAGASAFAKTNGGESALAVATRRCHQDIIAMLSHQQ